MFRIDWIYRDTETKKSEGFPDLIASLATAPNEQLFSTDLINVLMASFWRENQLQIRYKVFLPFVVYLCTTVHYFSSYLDKDLEDEDRFSFDGEFFTRCILYICIIYFTYYEVKQLLRTGLKYLTYSTFNAFDVISIVLNVAIIAKRNWYHDMMSNDTLGRVASVAVWLMWVKILYWMRLFDSTSFFVRLLSDTVIDSLPFTLMLSFIISAFANALYLLNQNQKREISIYE